MSDDDDSERFIDVEGLGVLSPAAFMLHSHSIINSFEDGTPGFISDDYLNAISAETTISAVELETVGLWERRDGGYLIKDEETISHLMAMRERADRLESECEHRGHHLASERDSRGWVYCTHCHVILERTDGKPIAGPDGSRMPR
ncbi:hypothetical protein IT072_15405 [Leifsonia sp. ZF2019]|uniref:hypothetical protein n=1 Tax=Leifsonia sp. ZF2019 TaxID=2781978 RepID=UPI001CBEB536|nr:hypothetical protein [Leifsonia sp. ZF2019]UAJ78615.1 hypothetical protein IT072_15405 [Leifsonia sp. ZF2019]